ncbi:hypothetical protein LCGC14_2120270, partial [marine sediment metagenome]
MRIIQSTERRKTVRGMDGLTHGERWCQVCDALNLTGDASIGLVVGAIESLQ